MIYLLILLLLIILMINLRLNDNDFISPSVVFTFSFLLSSIFVALYSERWGLVLYKNTFFVILGGVITFSILANLIKKLFYIIYGSKLYSKNWKITPIYIEPIKLYIFMIFQVLTILLSVYNIVKLVNGSLANFTEAISQYRDANLFLGESLALPSYVFYSRIAVDAAGYWFGYILINNYVTEKRISKKLFVIVLLSMICSYVSGGRNGMINIFLALICAYFLIKNKQNGFTSVINIKLIIKLILSFVIGLVIFESLATWIGRDGFESATGLEYLAIYIGAPIKNLDVFLQTQFPNKGIYESQTLINLMNWIGPKLHLINAKYTLDLPFKKFGLISLGNVYTTFYSFIYDFGYPGVVFFTSIMAIISQVIYEFVRKTRKIYFPPLSNIVYIFLFNTLLMAFFSNKFYEQFANIYFLQQLVMWVIFEFIFCRLFISNKIHNLYKETVLRVNEKEGNI